MTSRVSHVREFQTNDSTVLAWLHGQDENNSALVSRLDKDLSILRGQAHNHFLKLYYRNNP